VVPIHYTLRFDLRNPDFAGVRTADRYAAALDMAEWADAHGCAAVVVSEHHGAPDGYLPSPVPVVAAMAARTRRVRLGIAALVAPFHDPLRLAEDLAVLDNLARGRLDLVLAAGYVPEEFAMFGVPMAERPQRTTEVLETLKAAFTGEPFAYRGRTVRVTPAPFTPGGPPVVLGGSSAGAARRAARLADGFLPTDERVWEVYRAERRRLGGTDPGASPTGSPGMVALAADPERGWRELGPYLLHHVNEYGRWQAATDTSSPYRPMADVEALRRGGLFAVLTPDELLARVAEAPERPVTLHPLCGGIPAELGWESLRLLEREVLPALSA
jgi:alkanesulfonate monooxygenase SsuD/methylene tetrahydromethanopterin reductase-like flavin-dependent oxidoreductase (luciferase family)